MSKYAGSLLTAILISYTSCKVTRNGAAKDDGKIEITFVQVNDVYEIAPVSGGKEGGMARVATIKKNYKRANPNTFLVMAGDFVSPSVYNSLKNGGKLIRGAQMIDAMNVAGMDLAVFGNHEFDISEDQLQDRINESTFSWVASNAFHKTQDGVFPFAKTNLGGTKSFPKSYIISVKDKDGTTARVGFIGLTIPSNRAEFVSYTDPLQTAKDLYNQIKDSADAVVAITHQEVEDDIKLATELPNLAAILGGHEHSGIFEKTGNVYITKALSNARSAYIVNLVINKNKHNFTVTTKLDSVNEKIAFDSATNAVVAKWKKIAEDNYATLGFDPKKIVITAGESLDGRETETRNRSTNLTKLITQAMIFACPQADAVIFNSGSIRLDDILTPPVSQYDIIRSLPFGGGIAEVDMKGSLLQQVLQTGLKNINNGGFLQSQPVVYNGSDHSFLINNAAIDDNKIYRVALTKYLLDGKETNLGFLNAQNAGITKIYPTDTSANNLQSDIRLALIKYLESTSPRQPRP